MLKNISDINKIKNLILVPVLLYRTSKKFFPRAQNTIKHSNTGINSFINKLDPTINKDIPEDNKQMSLNLKKSLEKELSQKLSDSDEDEDDIDEKLNQGWGKKEEIKVDPYYEKYFQYAKVNDTLMDIPSNMEAAAQKVFSKHVISDIRYWSRKFLLNYSQNHACEPPIDLKNLPENTPLFANSEELNIKVKLFNVLNEKDKEKKNEKDDKEKVIDINEGQNQNKKETLNPIKVEYKPAQCVSYLHCRMPYTYNVAKRISFEIAKRIPDFKPNSVLDYGAGLGSCIWAANDVFSDATRLAAVEPNKDMRRLGKFLTTMGKLDKEILWVESLTMIPGTGSDRGKFDLIFLSHVLQEISTAKIRQLLLETLFNRLNENGVLVVVEPGSPKGYRFIHDLRKWVIDKPREDASIVSPCPHHMECPMATQRNSWCHFSQLSYKWSRDIFPKLPNQKDIHNEKFCYLVIRKGKTPNAIFKSEDETDKDVEKSYFWERIIRPVIKKQRHNIVDLCNSKGKFERRIIAKSHGTLGGFKSSKLLNWGDLWYVPFWIPNKFRKDKIKGKRLW